MSESLKDLSLFVTVVEKGGFASSADILGLSPSAVSKAIARLEDRIGVRLFARSTRTIKPTEAGIEFYSRALSILAAIEEAEAIVTEISTEPRGDLVVSCSDAFATLVVVPMLVNFQQQFPRIKVHIDQGDGPMDLVKEHYDIAIRFERPEQKGLQVTPLADDPWIVCAAPSYLENVPKPERPGDLREHRCLAIRARGRLDDHWLFRGGKRHAVTVNPVFSGIGMVVKSAALQGLGVARLARFLVANEIERGELVALLDDFQIVGQRQILAVTPDRGFMPVKTRVFLEALHRGLM